MWSAISTAISVLALIVALLAWRASGRSSWRRQLRSLRVEFMELHGSMDELLLTWQRFRSREGMADLRARRRDALAAPAELVSPTRRPGDSKAEQRRVLGVPDNPVQAVLKNLGGEFKRRG
jgi:hypothetical protein